MDRGIAFFRLQIADRQTSPAALYNETRKPPEDWVVITRIQQSIPVAEIAQRAFRFEPVADGAEILHDFQLRNTGNAPLNINKVRTG